MAKRLTTFVVLILCAYNLSAQEYRDLFYDRDWLLTRSGSAVYRRSAELDTINLGFEGVVIDYNESGKLIMKGSYKDRIKDGQFFFYYPNGQIESSGSFSRGSRTGTWNYYYPNGKPKQEIEFTPESFLVQFYNDSTGKQLLKDGTGTWEDEIRESNDEVLFGKGSFRKHKRHGEWTFSLKDGTVMFKEFYKNGKFRSGTRYAENGKKEADYDSPIQISLPLHFKFHATETFAARSEVTREDYPFLGSRFPHSPEVHAVVDESGSPSCGLQEFFREVHALIVYSEEAKKNKVVGKIFVEFIINEDGGLSDFRIIKGIGSGCDEEAVRILVESQKKCPWHPGRIDGTTVKQVMVLPLSFKAD